MEITVEKQKHYWQFQIVMINQKFGLIFHDLDDTISFLLVLNTQYITFLNDFIT